MATPRKTTARKPAARKATAKKTAAKKTAAQRPEPSQTPQQQQESRFADLIDHYPDDFLACRDMGHAWKPVTATREKNGTITRTLSCVRCATTRNQALDQYGYVITNNYAYKSGYSLPGTGRLTPAHRAALRLKNVLGD